MKSSTGPNSRALSSSWAAASRDFDLCWERYLFFEELFLDGPAKISTVSPFFVHFFLSVVFNQMFDTGFRRKGVLEQHASSTCIVSHFGCRPF